MFWETSSASASAFRFSSMSTTPAFNTVEFLCERSHRRDRTVRGWRMTRGEGLGSPVEAKTMRVNKMDFGLLIWLGLGVPFVAGLIGVVAWTITRLAEGGKSRENE